MTVTPAENTVAAKLATLGYGTVGSTIRIGPEQAVSSVCPSVCCFVHDTGGVKTPYIDGAGADDNEVNVLVVFRGDPNAYTTAKANSENAMQDIHKTTMTGYYAVVVNQGSVTYLGKTSTGQHRFSFNVRCRQTVA